MVQKPKNSILNQQPNHQEQFHDANETMSWCSEPTDEWNPKRDYQRMFQEVGGNTTTSVSSSSSSSPTTPKATATITEEGCPQQSSSSSSSSPPSSSVVTTHRVVRNQSSNIFVTVDFRNDTGTTSFVLPASPTDTKKGRNSNRSSWMKQRNRGARMNDMDCGSSSSTSLSSSSSSLSSRSTTDPTSSSSSSSFSSVGTRSIQSSPISIRSIPTNSVAERDEPCPNRITERPTTEPMDANRGTVISQDPVTPPKTPSNTPSTQTHTKSILRSSIHLTPTNTVSHEEALPATTTQKTTSITPTKTVSFADVLHTECTISVSPDNPRRSVRRQRNHHASTRTPSTTPKDDTNGDLSIGSGGPPSLVGWVRVLVLLMDAMTKQYELTSLHFPPYSSINTHTPTNHTQPIQLGSLLKQIRRSTTYRPLQLQHYIGFCRPSDGREMINSLTVRDNAIEDGEILIAIPVGLTGRLCKDLARPILADPGFGALVERLRKRNRKGMGSGTTTTTNNDNNSSSSRRRKKEMVADGRRKVIKCDGTTMERWIKSEWWIGCLVLGIPFGLLLWTLMLIGIQKEKGGFVFHDIGLSKLVNALVDDFDIGI